MSLLFIGIGFLVNEKNAKYLLAGYNTMSKKEREKVNIEKYIPFFKKFHLFLGLSFGFFGFMINYFIGEGAAGFFLGIYPILAYIVLIWEGRNYTKSESTKWYKVSIAILIAILIGVIGLFYYGYEENEISFDQKQIEISGMYGTTIKAEEIATIELIENTPKIKYRSNGFALGSIKKGYFKTSDGETILLILNSDNKPLILIQLKSKAKIYYSAKEKSNEAIFKELKATFPDIVF